MAVRSGIDDCVAAMFAVAGQHEPASRSDGNDVIGYPVGECGTYVVEAMRWVRQHEDITVTIGLRFAGELISWIESDRFACRGASQCHQCCRGPRQGPSHDPGLVWHRTWNHWAVVGEWAGDQLGWSSVRDHVAGYAVGRPNDCLVRAGYERHLRQTAPQCWHVGLGDEPARHLDGDQIVGSAGQQLPASCDAEQRVADIDNRWRL